MPKNTFDYTEMRTRVDELIKRLGDLATSASDREEYLELCYNLTLIRGLTDYYYTPRRTCTGVRNKTF